MMKALKLSTLTFCLLIFISSSAMSQSADNEPVLAEKPNVELRSKIVKMIRYANLTGVPRNQRDATIDFLITNDDQVLVLNVDTFSPYLRDFIKDHLNYKSISVKGVKKLTTYSLDVKFAVKS